MAIVRAELSDELISYIDSLVDNEIILNRTDSLRNIVVQHRIEHKQIQALRDGVN